MNFPDLDFNENGSDGGVFGDFDRMLLLETISLEDIVIRPPKRQCSEKPPQLLQKVEESVEKCCVFCKNNGRTEQEYSSHEVKDSRGRCTCPVLRCYKCPICGASGDGGHTKKYCPRKKIFTPEDIGRMIEMRRR